MLSLSTIGNIVLLSIFALGAVLIALPRLLARRDARSRDDEPEQPRG